MYFYYNSQHVQQPSTKTQSNECYEFCHFQDGNQYTQKASSSKSSTTSSSLLSSMQGGVESPGSSLSEEAKQPTHLGGGRRKGILVISLA